MTLKAAVGSTSTVRTLLLVTQSMVMDDVTAASIGKVLPVEWVTTAIGDGSPPCLRASRGFRYSTRCLIGPAARKPPSTNS